MHLFDAGRRFYGGNAIVGGGLPLAVGPRPGRQMPAPGRGTACFFGDGAVAEGEFHESLNLAALWQLPVLFCCENNLYAMGTALARSEAQTDLALQGRGYGMPAWAVDGMDVVAVEARSGAAAERIRAGAGPYFLELRTYRFRAHSMYDPERLPRQGRGRAVEASATRSRRFAERLLRGMRRRRASTRSSRTVAARSTPRSRSPRPARYEPVERPRRGSS